MDLMISCQIIIASETSISDRSPLAIRTRAARADGPCEKHEKNMITNYYNTRPPNCAGRC